jgi:two-component system, cell cycle sensor histidine kinase and response regulator CckA
MKTTETILIVDDIVSNRLLIKEILSIQDYHILEATDGEDAIKICTEHDGFIHLLVTDLVMPKLNGLELVKILRPLRPEMKILYTSGYFTDINLQIEVWDKLAEFIAKPFSPNGLLKKVGDMLESQSQSKDPLID